ncbi:RNA polymerase sigma factor [Thomasclavelia sp.]
MDREEYKTIVNQYSDMVTRIAIMNVKNVDDAKDCYQNVFMKLYCCNKEFDSLEHLKAWLIRVTINECKDYQKQFWKRNIDIDEIIIGKQDEKLIILPVIMKLASKYRNVLYLYYYEGYSTKEIAKILKVNVNTVKSQLIRGRKLLKKKLGDDFYE